MSTEPFIGQIIFFAGNFAPRGWAFCEGQLLAISQHSTLFTILGTTYGGDGRNTFALPDLRGRSIVGTGSGPNLQSIALGSRGGAERVILSAENLPPHSHTVSMPVSSNPGTTPEAQGNVPANAGRFDNDYNGMPDMENTLGNTGEAGGSVPFNIRSPYLGINAIIALQGAFPPRN